MTNHVLLDNVAHRDLKVITRHSERYGDNVICTTVFPIELRQLQKEYPIVFCHDPKTEVFEPVALFGLKEKENLFLSDPGWDAKYIPLMVERQPFLIGFQTADEAGIPVEKPVIHIDMDSPRISSDEGEQVFMKHGGNSLYLQKICTMLEAIHEGHKYNLGFSDTLKELQLVEPFTLKIELNDHAKYELQGFYTINEDRFKALKGDVLEKLHYSGYLDHLYMILASLSNIKTLVDKKNARL